MAKVNREIIRGFPSCQHALNKSLSSLGGDKDSSELSMSRPLINHSETCYSAFQKYKFAHLSAVIDVLGFYGGACNVAFS